MHIIYIYIYYKSVKSTPKDLWLTCLIKTCNICIYAHLYIHSCACVSVGLCTITFANLIIILPSIFDLEFGQELYWSCFMMVYRP